MPLDANVVASYVEYTSSSLTKMEVFNNLAFKAESIKNIAIPIAL